MDIEQLKLIVDTISSLGVESKSAFIWWLVVSKIPAIIFGLIWSGISIVVITKVFTIIQNTLYSERLRKAAGVSCCWDDGEFRAAEKILKEHFNK